MHLFWPPLGSMSVIRGCAKPGLPIGSVPDSGSTPPEPWLTPELRGFLEIVGCAWVPKPLGSWWLSRAPLPSTWRGVGSLLPLVFMSTCDIFRLLCLSVFLLLYRFVYISVCGGKTQSHDSVLIKDHIYLLYANIVLWDKGGVYDLSRDVETNT